MPSKESQSQFRAQQGDSFVRGPVSEWGNSQSIVSNKCWNCHGFGRTREVCSSPPGALGNRGSAPRSNRSNAYRAGASGTTNQSSFSAFPASSSSNYRGSSAFPAGSSRNHRGLSVSQSGTGSPNRGPAYHTRSHGRGTSQPQATSSTTGAGKPTVGTFSMRVVQPNSQQDNERAPP